MFNETGILEQKNQSEAAGNNINPKKSQDVYYLIDKRTLSHQQLELNAIVAQRESDGKGSFKFVDKRSEAAAQRKLDAMINNSSRIAAQQKQLNNDISTDKAVIQRVSIIDYDPTANFSYDWPVAALPGAGMPLNTQFATTMGADLDVNQPVHGSGPTQAVAPGRARADTQWKYGGAWVLGHLLNDDLGGLGIQSNLAPITDEANMEHYYVMERRVKNELYRQPPGGNFDLANAGYLQYEVDVNIVNPPWSSANPDVDYDCRVRTQVDQGWLDMFGNPIPPAVAPVWNPWWNYTVESRHDDAVAVPLAWASAGQALRPGGFIPVTPVILANYVAAMAAAGGGPVWRVGAQAALIQNSGAANAQVIGWQF
jgi:hypothetical protein